MKTILAVLLLIACWCSQLLGEYSGLHLSWPTIRGPELNGLAIGNNLADRWPTGGPPVLWTRELGQGYSSFIAWDHRVATQYQNLGGQYVVCLNADNGTTIWQHRYGWPYDPAGVYPGPRSTPTYDMGLVYFTSPSGLVGCLKAESGELVWSVELEKMFGIRVPGFGYACSPIVVDDKIILPVGGLDASFVAINKRDGTIRWKSLDLKTSEAPRRKSKRESSASYCSVYPISFRGRKCIVGYLENSLLCFDSETGESLWRHELSSGYDEHSAWPIYDEPYLWITGAFQRGSELLEITGEPSRPIRTVRQRKLMSNDIFSSVLYDGALFGFDLHEAQAKTHRTSRGVFRCVDFRTGDALWSNGSGRLQRNSLNASGDVGVVTANKNQELEVGHATVLVADGKLILWNDLGELILAKASRERYEELSRTSILGGEICWTQPAMARSRLYMRNHSRAVCVYLGPPEALEDELREKSIAVSQVPHGKFRDIAGILLGVEPEYLFDVPSLDWLWNWYWLSLGILVASFFLTQCLFLIFQIGKRTTAKPAPASIALLRRGDDVAFFAIAFVFGGLGTTFLSRLTQEFVFTWPVCLYVAWCIAIANMSSRSVSRNRWQKLQSSSAAVFLLSACFVYFLLCRRLSLVFEWVFLAGFLASLPFELASKHLLAKSRMTVAWRFAMTCIGFSAYFWASAAILFLRG